jgi:hypothetical protein
MNASRKDTAPFGFPPRGKCIDQEMEELRGRLRLAENLISLYANLPCGKYTHEELCRMAAAVSSADRSECFMDKYLKHLIELSDEMRNRIPF